MSGWIKIHRSITDHWLYNEKRTYSKLEAWYDLLLNVNYTDAKIVIKGKLYEVKRGQSIMSLDSWAKRWNWDKSKVRRFLVMLQKDEMIELISDNITTQLTICKYESYQGDGNADETRKKRKRNANEIQTTPIEESKENKNNTYSFLASLLDNGFDEKLSREWMEVRKQLKAVNTETAFNSFMSQVQKHGGDRNHILRKCVERSWKGFNANWLEKENDRLLNALKNN
jgi:hypothetical protein